MKVVTRQHLTAAALPPEGLAGAGPPCEVGGVYALSLYKGGRYVTSMFFREGLVHLPSATLRYERASPPVFLRVDLDG